MTQIILLSMFILLSACSTTAPALKSQNFNHLFNYRSGLIVPAEVLGTSDANANCKMEFSDAKGLKQNLAFQPGKDIYFIELPAGIYQVSKLSCGRGVYTVDNQPPWSRFVINDGSLSYFSLLRFNVDREAMVQNPNREDSVEAFTQTWKALSNSDRQRLVLGMDGRKLTEKMKDIQKDVSFHFQSAKPPANDNELKEPVMDCYKKEIIQNHTILGKMEYDISYRNSKLEKITPGSRSANTYTPQFYECIEKAFNDFEPSGSTALKVTL